MDNEFSAGGIELVPEFVHSASVGFVGYDDHGSILFLMKCAADDFEFILSVDDRGVQHVNRFCGDSLAAKNLIVEIGFAGIVNAQLSERARLRAGMSQPNFTGVTVAINRSGFEGTGRKVAAEHGDGVGFLQGIFPDQPVADGEHERESGGNREQSESAENCENTE